MPALAVSNTERDALLALDALLDQALGFGVEDETPSIFIERQEGYVVRPRLSPDQKKKAREFGTALTAAIMSAGIVGGGGGGTVSLVNTGAGLTGGPISTTGTISIATGGVTNSMLVNSALTVTAGDGLTGGGSISLGGSATLDVGAGDGITVNADDVSVDSTVVRLTAMQELTNKTLTAMVVKDGLTATGSASNDFSGSTGTFKTSTGAVSLAGDSTVLTGKTFSIADMTAGSIPYFGNSGLVSQNNAALFWDNTNKAFGIGINTPGTFSGPVTVTGTRLHLYSATEDSFLLVEASTAANKDAGILFFTPTVNVDAGIFLDESDSQKLKIAMGSVSSDANRTSNTKVTITQGGSVGVGTTSPSAAHAVHGEVTLSTSVPFKSRNTHASGVGGYEIYNNADVFKLQLGFNNTGGDSYIYTGSSVDFKVQTNNGAQVHIFKSGGTVGLGVTAVNASNRLEVSGAATVGTYTNTVAPTNGLIVSGTAGFGTSSPGSGHQVYILAATPTECLALRSTSATGYSDMVWFDSANVQKGGVGWGNATVGATNLRSLNFFYTPNVDWIMADGTTNFYRWYNGASAIGFEMSQGNSATVSLSNTGKLRYNSSSQLFQMSENGGAYDGVALLAKGQILSNKTLASPIVTGTLLNASTLVLESGIADTGANVGVATNTTTALTSGRRYFEARTGGIAQWAFYTTTGGAQTLEAVAGSSSRVYGNAELYLAASSLEASYLRLHDGSDVRLVGAVGSIELRAPVNVLAKSTQADSAIALCLDVDTTNTWADAAAKLQRWQTGGFERLAVMASTGAIVNPSTAIVRSGIANASTNVGVATDTTNALTSGRHYFEARTGGTAQWAMWTAGSGEVSLEAVAGTSSQLVGNGDLVVADSAGSNNVLQLTSTNAALSSSIGEVFLFGVVDVAAQATPTDNATAVVFRVNSLVALTDAEASLQHWSNNSVEKFRLTASGQPRWSDSGNTQTTVGAAGAASALPATPSKYFKVQDDSGTTYVFPVYAAA